MIVKLRKPYTVEIAASHGRGTAAVAELELPAERTFTAVREGEGRLRLSIELTGRGVIIPLSVVVPESAVEVVLK